MSEQELLPGGLSITLWCRFQTVCLENVSDRATRDLVAEIRQRALYPAISPIVVLGGHAYHEVFDLFVSPGSSRAALLAAVVLPGNQSPVPSQERFGRDDGGYFAKDASAELLRFCCQAATLVVAEPKPLVSQLLPQNTILLTEVINDVALLLDEPACE